MKIFAENANLNHKVNECMLFLNGVLLNHSCAPNTLNDTIEDGSIEVRAIKDISKGEEISIFYHSSDGFSYKKFGCNVKERMKVIKDRFGFDCKYCVCVRDLPDQEDIIKELLGLKLDREAANQSEEGLTIFLQDIDRLVDLNLRLYIGSVYDKIRALKMMAWTAFKIKDADLLERATKQMKKIAEETELKNVMMLYEEMMRNYY